MAQKHSLKKIVITGGAGYIGNTLISALPESVEIVVIDNFHIDTPHKREVNASLQQTRNVRLITANVSEVELYTDALNDVDVVVYMASLNSHTESNEQPSLYLTENVLNFQRFLDVLKQQSPNVQKVILTSSRGVYGEGAYDCVTCGNRVSPTAAETLVCPECLGSILSPRPLAETDRVNPSSYYGLSKKMQEDVLTQFCRQNSISLDIFRIFNVYGEEQGKYYSHIGIIPRMFDLITNKGEISLSGNGKLTRDFIHVEDVVSVLVKSMYRLDEQEKAVEIYNLGSGHAVSIEDLADFFSDVGYTFKRTPLSAFSDVRYSVADHTKAKKSFQINTFANISDFLTNLYSPETQALKI
jgi:dTDP-L-rhamnose 4-epimerase